MSTLYVTELKASGNSESGSQMQMAKQPPVTDQTVTFTTSTQSAAFNADTRFVRLHPKNNCHVAFGASPTATTSNMPMLADSVEYFAVIPGQKLAVVDA
jgi:hypothetical protein